MRPLLACHGDVYTLDKKGEATVTLSLLKESKGNSKQTRLHLLISGRDESGAAISFGKTGILYKGSLGDFGTMRKNTFSKHFAFRTAGVYVITILAWSDKHCPMCHDATGAYSEITTLHFPFRIVAGADAGKKVKPGKKVAQRRAAGHRSAP